MSTVCCQRMTTDKTTIINHHAAHVMLYQIIMLVINLLKYISTIIVAFPLWWVDCRLQLSSHCILKAINLKQSIRRWRQWAILPRTVCRVNFLSHQVGSGSGIVCEVGPTRPPEWDRLGRVIRSGSHAGETTVFSCSLRQMSTSTKFNFLARMQCGYIATV